MKKNPFNPLKMMAMLTLAVAVLFVSSCGDDEDACEKTWYADIDNDGLGDPEMTIKSCDQPEGYVSNADDNTDTVQDIWSFIQGREDMDSLAKYLEAYPDLTTALSSQGNYTVFAPNDDAFISLITETPGFPQDVRSINPEIIKGVLSYHVSATEYAAADLTSGKTITTLTTGQGPDANNEDVVVVNSDGTLKTGGTNQNIELLTTNIEATNGTVHVVKSVLIPVTVGRSLTPLLGTNGSTILLGKNFSILASLIRKADGFAVQNQLTPLTAVLSTKSADSVHTVFAPTNATFEAAADKQAGNDDGTTTTEELEAFLGSFTDQQLYGIIAHHVVIGDNNDDDADATIGAEELTTGKSYTTAAGSTITFYKVDNKGKFTDIFIDSDGNFNSEDGSGLNAEVVLPNAAENNNGIVHVIAGLLLPPTP